MTPCLCLIFDRCSNRFLAGNLLVNKGTELNLFRNNHLCNDLAATFTQSMLAELPHPWLLIEDSHVNLLGILEYFDQNGFQNGDYLIVEDTSQSMWDYWRDRWSDPAEVEEGARKLKDMTDWLKKHQDEYLVDTYYQDMYGYNGSKNWNSILKRV